MYNINKPNAKHDQDFLKIKSILSAMIHMYCLIIQSVLVSSNLILCIGCRGVVLTNYSILYFYYKSYYNGQSSTGTKFPEHPVKIHIYTLCPDYLSFMRFCAAVQLKGVVLKKNPTGLFSDWHTDWLTGQKQYNTATF